MARVQILREVKEEAESEPSYRLCFQWCRYLYDDNTIQEGYRFVWRRPDNSIQAARGQVRIPASRALRL